MLIMASRLVFTCASCFCRQQAIDKTVQRATSTASWLASHRFLTEEQLQHWQYLVGAKLSAEAGPWSDLTMCVVML